MSYITTGTVASATLLASAGEVGIVTGQIITAATTGEAMIGFGTAVVSGAAFTVMAGTALAIGGGLALCAAAEEISYEGLNDIVSSPSYLGFVDTSGYETY